MNIPIVEVGDVVDLNIDYNSRGVVSKVAPCHTCKVQDKCEYYPDECIGQGLWFEGHDAERCVRNVTIVKRASDKYNDQVFNLLDDQ